MSRKERKRINVIDRRIQGSITRVKVEIDSAFFIAILLTSQRYRITMRMKLISQL